ncbi:MAG: electron transfer flavoprotein subunit alpha/FixB family protein [Anaerolineae bacterium]
MEDLSYYEALMGELEEEDELSAYRHVWVVAESRDGSLAAISHELLGAARDIADRLGVYVQAVLMGHQVRELSRALIQLGADTVYVADDPALAQYQVEAYAVVLAELINERKPEIVLLGATDLGRDLAPRLAQRLGTGLVTDCVQLEIDESQRQLLTTRASHDDRLLTTLAIPRHRPQIATLRPGVFRPALPDEYHQGDVEEIVVDVPESALRTKLLRVSEGAERAVPLSKAKVIVAGGRGMGDAKSFAMLEELAELLGGEVAGSLGAVEEGFVSAERKVDATGHRVAADLYIACGISGSTQHYLGMKEAKYVVAINRNPQAPIFERANVGLVGDVHQILPLLIEEIRAQKSKLRQK